MERLIDNVVCIGKAENQKIIKAIITLLMWEIIKEKLPSDNGRETEETITMPNRVRKNTEKIMPQSKSFKS